MTYILLFFIVVLNDDAFFGYDVGWEAIFFLHFLGGVEDLAFVGGGFVWF